MSQISLPVVFDDSDLPLPLRAANRWNFRLRTSEYNGVKLYRLHDWLTGLVDEKYTNQRIRDFRRPGDLFENYVGSIHTVKEPAPRHKDVDVEYVTDKLLYRVTEDIRLTEKRKGTTLVAGIKDFLAKSGAFVDLVRREPETIVQSGILDPDKVLDAVIEEYRRRGKDDRWISARLSGKIKRAKFTAALKAAVDEMLGDYHYATATDDIYLGLWKRTTAQLKGELSLSRNASLRDNQPTLALIYQGLAEEVSAQKLGDRTELSWEEARDIIKEVARLIGVQAQATSRFLGVDLATGKPLLSAGNA